MENVADMMTKHVPRGDRNDGLLTLGEETAKFQEYSSIEQSCWNQKLATMENCRSSIELEHDVRIFVDKTTHLTTAVLRRGVEMSML